MTLARAAFALCFAAVVALALPAAAFAAGLNATFETTPLFSEADIAPGLSTTKTIGVENGDAAPEELYIEAVNTADTGLAGALTIVVEAGGSTLYTGTLAEFFDGAPHAIELLGARASDTLAVTIAFSSAAGNSYQGVSAGFDLCVGLVNGGETCDGSASPVPQAPTDITSDESDTSIDASALDLLAPLLALIIGPDAAPTVTAPGAGAAASTARTTTALEGHAASSGAPDTAPGEAERAGASQAAGVGFAGVSGVLDSRWLALAAWLILALAVARGIRHRHRARALVRPGDEGGEEEPDHPERQEGDDNDGEGALHAP